MPKGEFVGIVMCGIDVNMFMVFLVMHICVFLGSPSGSHSCH